MNGHKLKVRCSLQITIYKVVQFRPIYNTVNPVYKEHLREPEKVPFMSRRMNVVLLSFMYIRGGVIND
jgi:hypothetical protein